MTIRTVLSSAVHSPKTVTTAEMPVLCAFSRLGQMAYFQCITAAPRALSVNRSITQRITRRQAGPELPAQPVPLENMIR